MRKFMLLYNVASIDSIQFCQLSLEFRLPFVLCQRFAYWLIRKVGQLFEMVDIVMRWIVWGSIRLEFWVGSIHIALWSMWTDVISPKMLLVVDITLYLDFFNAVGWMPRRFLDTQHSARINGFSWFFVYDMLNRVSWSDLAVLCHWQSPQCSLYRRCYFSLWY